jgi:hypothetical protein
MNNKKSYNVQDIDEIVQWEIIFEALSMERIEPFLSEMGLPFLNASAIRPIVRQFLQEIEGVDDVETQQVCIQEAFVKLETEASPDTAQKLHWWGKWTFASKKQGGLYFWAVLLRWLAGLHNTHIPVVHPALDEQKLRAIIQNIRNKFADDLDLERKLEHAEKAPKSKWDDDLYQKIEGEYSPLMFASKCIRNNRTQQIWDFIKTLLSKKELDTLLIWAKENAPSLQIDAELITIPA